MESEVYFFDGQWWFSDRLSQLHALPCEVKGRDEAVDAAGRMGEKE